MSNRPLEEELEHCAGKDCKCMAYGESECGCGCGVDWTPAEVYELRAEIELLRMDAERYRWLRERSWSCDELCVVASPKQAVKPGHDCPSRNRLDEAIDAAMKGANG